MKVDHYAVYVVAAPSQPPFRHATFGGVEGRLRAAGCVHGAWVRTSPHTAEYHVEGKALYRVVMVTV